jgi:NAD(P)-dependent dehydrogenase (short-subunit alcohol dehydrogenase family)
VATDLTGKVALVTGAGSGMGRRAAQRLAAAGARVAALDVDAEKVDELAAADPRITGLACDVTDRDQVRGVVAQVESELGPLHRVMNAAGIARVGPLLERGPEEILAVMAVNYGGTVNLVDATLPLLLARADGQLVNFASLAGWISTKKMGAYCASKFAVVAYSEALWLENRGRGVRIACVCPPAVDTPMLADIFADPAKRRRSMAITPEQVLDSVEHALERDRFLVLPTAQAKALWRARRHAPRLTRAFTDHRWMDLV